MLCRDFASHLSVQTTTVSFLWRLFVLSCRGKVPRGGRSDDLCSRCWTGGRKGIPIYQTESRVTCFHKENGLVSFSRGTLMLTSAKRSAKSTRCKQSACIITAHAKVKASVRWLICQTFFFLWSRFTTLDILLRVLSFNPRRSRISHIIWAHFSVKAWWNDLNMAEMFYDHEGAFCLSFLFSLLHGRQHVEAPSVHSLTCLSQPTHLFYVTTCTIFICYNKSSQQILVLNVLNITAK